MYLHDVDIRDTIIMETENDFFFNKSIIKLYMECIKCSIIVFVIHEPIAYRWSRLSLFLPLFFIRVPIAYHRCRQSCRLSRYTCVCVTLWRDSSAIASCAASSSTCPAQYTPHSVLKHLLFINTLLDQV